jgi:hypothetical protein
MDGRDRRVVVNDGRSSSSTIESRAATSVARARLTEKEADCRSARPDLVDGILAAFLMDTNRPDTTT